MERETVAAVICGILGERDGGIRLERQVKLGRHLGGDRDGGPNAGLVHQHKVVVQAANQLVG